MKRRAKLLITSTLLLGLLLVGGTLAWFTHEGQVTNSFTTGDVAITLHDMLDKGDFPEDGISNVMPGNSYDKKIYVSSEGSIDSYVRVKLTSKWTSDPQGPADIYLPTDNVELAMADSKWVYKDGWYYYTEPLGNGEETESLLDSIVFDGEGTDNRYRNAIFTIEARAEGIQAGNEAAVAKWGVNPENP